MNQGPSCRNVIDLPVVELAKSIWIEVVLEVQVNVECHKGPGGWSFVICPVECHAGGLDVCGIHVIRGLKGSCGEKVMHGID